MDKGTILKTIADNPVVMDELKKLFMDEFALTDLKVTDSNELLGQTLKAHLLAKNVIESVFDKILQYKTVEPKVVANHPGR